MDRKDADARKEMDGKESIKECMDGYVLIVMSV
jgi:hypothetical protein